MANILATEKKIAVVSALAEGASIRAIERMTGVNQNTIMSLGLRIGAGCAAIMDTKMRDLPCRRIEVDEIWGFIGAKAKNVTAAHAGKNYGDIWTWIALDPDSKVIPSFLVGRWQAYIRTLRSTKRHMPKLVDCRLSARRPLPCLWGVSCRTRVEPNP